MNDKKLYEIEIMRSETFFVVADDPTSAYDLLRSFLDDREWYFTDERKLRSIRQLAVESEVPGPYKLLLGIGFRQGEKG